MIKRRLAAALSLAIFTCSSAYSAQYEVVELPLADKGGNNFPAGLTNSGTAIANVSPLLYSVPIDVTQIDFDQQLISDPVTDLGFVPDPETGNFPTIEELLTDPDAAKAGNINLIDYTILRDYLKGSQALVSDQKISTLTPFSVMGQQISSIDAFNTLDEQAQNTFDATTVVTDVDRINGTVVGHGEDGFNRIPYTYWEGTGEENEIETSFVLNDFTRRGFVDINDMTIELPPIDTTLGGRSEALGVNSQLQVVGFSNTEFLSAEGQFELNYAPCPFDDTQETCSVNLFEEDVIIGLGAGGQVLYDLNKIVDEFFQVLPSDCITEGDNIETAQECALRVLQLGTRLIPENFSQNRGMIWQLDDSGNITETTQLGLLFTPEEDDNRVYSSLATGINDNGIAVGQSSDFFDFGDSELVATFAAMFVNDEVIHITSKEIDRSLAIQMISNQVSLFSSATDINNNDLVTGYQLKLVNGFLRRKFFVYDANTSELIFPQDFFNGSSSIPLDINNNNLVVGYGEIEATQVSRRTGGFLYDHNTGEFNDLNSLIDCDSPYFITQANSINDDGDIIATALVKAPIRNLRGEVILENNEPVLTDSVVSVVLQRVSESTPQECEVDEDEQEIRPRQGASVFWLLGLAGIALFRRRLK